MEIEFSEHAREQLKRRKIARKHALETIRDGKTGKSFKARIVYRKEIKNKILEVVATKENRKLVIITAYYLYENKLRS